MRFKCDKEPEKRQHSLNITLNSLLQPTQLFLQSFPILLVVPHLLSVPAGLLKDHELRHLHWRKHLPHPHHALVQTLTHLLCPLLDRSQLFYQRHHLSMHLGSLLLDLRHLRVVNRLTQIRNHFLEPFILLLLPLRFPGKDMASLVSSLQ